MEDLTVNNPDKLKKLLPLSEGDINGEKIQTVDARDLYEFLEVRSNFRDWIKNRIDDYSFTDSVDYVTFLDKTASGQAIKNYHLTLDMAKELAMVERNDKGKRARKYFIECEKRLLAPVKSVTFKESLKLLIAEIEKNEKLEGEIQTNATLVNYAKAVVTANNGVPIRDWVSTMKKEQGLQVGERKVINFLIDRKILYRKENNQLRPYADRFDWFSAEPLVLSRPQGNKEVVSLKITGTGQVALTDQVLGHFVGQGKTEAMTGQTV